MRGAKLRRSSGGWVGAPPPGLLPKVLRDYLPRRLRDHPGADGFMADVAEAAVFARARARGLARASQSQRRDSLAECADVARRMLGNLRMLDDDARDDLEVFAEYAIRRWQEKAPPVEGRPAVPPAPRGVPPSLGRLLERLQNDLGALVALVDAAADKYEPDRNPPKVIELALATTLAAQWAARFKEAPPVRGTFAELAKYAGAEVGLEVGTALAAEAVRAVRAAG
jgi:hypothetical protein